MGRDRFVFRHAGGKRTVCGANPAEDIEGGGVRAGDALAEHPRVRIQRFEDLVHRPEHEGQAICDFLGLAFEPAMLEISRIMSSHDHDDDDAPAGLDPSAAARWKAGGLSATEIAICQHFAPDEVRRHVLERLEIFSRGGGFIMSTIHNILPEVPPENIVATFDAVREFNDV